MAKRFTLLLAFVSVYSFGKCGKLPSTFSTCKRNDPDLEGCFTKAVTQVLPLLKEPIPQLGLPSIEPVEVDRISIESNTGSFSVIQEKIKVHNVIQTKVNKTEIALENDKIKMVIYTYSPLFKLEADYEFNGQVLQLPLTGKGKCQVDIEGLHTITTMTGDIIEKKSKKYMHLKETTVKVDPSLVRFNFENLFNGDERLGAEMNKLMNENWRVLYEDIGPAYETVLAAYFKKIADAIFDRVTFDELFPL